MNAVIETQAPETEAATRAPRVSKPALTAIEISSAAEDPSPAPPEAKSQPTPTTPPRPSGRITVIGAPKYYADINHVFRDDPLGGLGNDALDELRRIVKSHSDFLRAHGELSPRFLRQTVKDSRHAALENPNPKTLAAMQAASNAEAAAKSNDGVDRAVLRTASERLITSRLLPLLRPVIAKRITALEALQTEMTASESLAASRIGIPFEESQSINAVRAALHRLEIAVSMWESGIEKPETILRSLAIKLPDAA